MKLEDVVDVLQGLDEAGIPVWVDGGWCVDAHLGRQSRQHADLDLAVDRASEQSLRDWLAERGYVGRCGPDDTPWNFFATDPDGRSLDLHVFSFDEDGRYLYGVEYPAESLTGEARLGDRRVQCIAPEWMFRFKTAYQPERKDLADIEALAKRFGYSIPATHHGF